MDVRKNIHLFHLVQVSQAGSVRAREAGPRSEVTSWSRCRGSDLLPTRPSEQTAEPHIHIWTAFTPNPSKLTPRGAGQSADRRGAGDRVGWRPGRLGQEGAPATRRQLTLQTLRANKAEVETLFSHRGNLILG